MVFSHPFAVSVEGPCEDGLLLDFPFHSNFDDVTCHHANAYSYGDGKVRIVDDNVRSRVAEFDGESHLQVCHFSRLLLVK